MPGLPYVTFFLCGHDWSHGFDAFAPAIERLLQLFSLERKAMLDAYVSPGVAPPFRKRSGRFERQSLSSWPADTMMVSVPAGSGRFRFFARLEGARYGYLPEYGRWLQPDAPPIFRDVGGQRLATLALEAALLARPAQAAEVVAVIEALFLDLGCVYAYGRPMAYFTVSEYDTIRSGPAWLLRVIDVDYRRFIEDVYAHNWLSAAHLQCLGDPDAVLRASPEARKLVDAQGGLRGVYLGTAGAGDSAVARLRERLAPLIVQDSPRRRSSLIIPPDGVRRMGLEALGGAFPATETSAWPGDIVVISDLRVPAYADPEGYRARIERVFSGTCAPGAERLSAAECMIEFVSPFDPYHLYRRFVAGPEDENAAKLRTGRIGDRAAVPVCLIARRRDDAVLALETLAAWTERVNAAPEVYGTLGWSAPPAVQARGTVHCAQGVMDTRGLREAAFPLLAVLLDELNAERCAVAYAVVGALDPRGHQPGRLAEEG